MIISVDFDGVLHFGSYPEIGIADANAAKCMQQIRRDGHYIIINTCRQGDYLISAVNWLLEQQIPFDRVNDNHPDNTAKYGTNSRKIYAHVYIDDRQVGGLPPWDIIYDHIKNINNTKK